MPNILYFVFISECVESVLQFGRFFSSRKFGGFFFLIFLAPAQMWLAGKSNCHATPCQWFPIFKRTQLGCFPPGDFGWTGIGRKRYVHDTRSTTKVFSPEIGGFIQGSLNYLFGGDQTMQMYGDFDGFPL